MMEEEAAAVSAEEERAADLMDLRRRGSTSWDVELVAFSIRAGTMAVDSSSISDISLFSFLSLFVGLIDCCCYYYIYLVPAFGQNVLVVLWYPQPLTELMEVSGILPQL